MIRKKLVPLVLAGCLITTGMPGIVFGAEANGSASNSTSSSTSSSIASIDIPATGEIVVTDTSSQEPKAEDLERIIQAVKGKITIPAELSKFDYYFSAESYYGGASWNLNWYTEDSSRRITVQSDSKGNILGFYSYDEKSGNYTPKYMKADLKAAADKFIKKVAADISGKIKYVSAESGGYGRGQYNYVYQRVENGIPMPDNKVTVGVNYETGVVTSYDAQWLYDTTFPSAEVKLTKEEAAAKLGKAINLKLTYQNVYSTDKDGKTKVKAYLVYAPENSYAAVDAKTGEVYTTQNEWTENQSSDEEAATGTKDAGGNGFGGLTQEEITKIDEIKGLISREAAIKAITGNKSLLLDENLKSISASLYKQNYYESGDSSYIWRINLSDPRETGKGNGDLYRAYASASVDAKTGKILSFNASVKDYYNMTQKEWETVKVKYSKEQGQKVLEDFLKEQAPDKFKNSVLSDNHDTYVIAYVDGKEVYGGYYYNYNRVNEGIEYSYNGIYGSVDGVTGKIYNFNLNWNNDITFESPKNAMSAQNALNIYLANEGFHLVYEVNNIHSYPAVSKDTIMTDASYSVNSEVRLVYRTDINPSNISPFTGKQLDYNGEEYVAPEAMYQYKDLSNTASEKNIRLLAEIGIGFKGGEFKPDKAVTTKELTEFLSQAGIYYNSNKYKLSNDDSTITRAAVSKFAVQILGYESIAKLKNIYAANFKDQNQISTEDLGYAALAQGLELVTANSSNEFRPTDKLTRAEAADLLVAMLSIEK